MWERRNPGLPTCCTCKTSVFLKPHIFSYNSPVIVGTEIKEGIKKVYLVQMHTGKKQSDCSFWLHSSKVVLACFLNISCFCLHLLMCWELIPHFSVQPTCDCTDWLQAGPSLVTPQSKPSQFPWHQLQVKPGLGGMLCQVVFSWCTFHRLPPISLGN